MRDYRKYACEISGILFKEVNRKGIRRDRLAKELNISENQIKNYAYDSTKSATLENFIQVLTSYRCGTVLGLIAQDMGYGIYRLPEPQQNGATPADAASDALIHTSKAVQSCLSKSGTSERDTFAAIEKLLNLLKTSESK